MAAVLTYLRAAFTSLLASLAHQYDCIIHSGLPLFFWVRPRFSVTDIPSQYGKVRRPPPFLSDDRADRSQVVLVTGGNSGTGYATCKALYDRGATVYMACRDGKKAREGIEAIERGGVSGVDGITYPDEGRMMNGNGNGHGNEVGKGKGRLEFLELDLADLRSVERCAEDLGR